MYERVAAVDVAKASGVVCLRTPDPARPGRFVNRLWDNVPAMRAQIAELGAELLRCRVQMVTLESTSDYWRIWYYVLESVGLAVQLVSASQAKNLKGRPKTDKLDAMCLARLTQWGMLRPSFVPPAAIRAVRDFTRARTDLVHERTRCLQRLEKLLEDAMVKITSVVSDGMTAKSAVAMVQALIAGERDPRAIADLAKGSLRRKRGALAEALDGMFDSHHGVIAQALLDQVAFLDQRITQMEAGAIAALAQVEESWGVDADGETGPGRGTGPDSRVLAAVCRLAEIPGVSVWLAIVIIAEIGLNMTLFPTPAHLVSWMGLCRSARQSGTRHRHGQGQERQQLRPRRRRAGRHRRRRHRHLPRRAVRAHRPPPRRGHRPGRRRPLHHDHRLAPAQRPRRPLPRPRPGLARQPHHPGQEDPHPPPRPASPRPHHHNHGRRGRLNLTPQTSRNALTRPGTSKRHRVRVSMPDTAPHATLRQWPAGVAAARPASGQHAVRSAAACIPAGPPVVEVRYRAAAGTDFLGQKVPLP